MGFPQPPSGGSGTVTSLAAADTSVVVAGTPTVAPTIRTNTLDVIATDHPPAADWSNNAKKITGLANGSAAADAAAFGQIPRFVTGQVAAVGTITAGTGFTVTHDSTGRYTVTFTVAFGAVPTVVVTAAVAAGVIADVFTIAAGSFHVAIATTIDSDQPFHFIAMTTL